MHYSPRNYELHIVRKYSVELKGFPKPVMCNTSDFSSAGQLNCLMRQLQDGSCRWEHLNEDEWDKRKNSPLREDTGLQKKVRSDKGTKRSRVDVPKPLYSSKQQRVAKSSEYVVSDGEEQEGHEEDGELQGNGCGDKENDISLA